MHLSIGFEGLKHGCQVAWDQRYQILFKGCQKIFSHNDIITAHTHLSRIATGGKVSMGKALAT